MERAPPEQMPEELTSQDSLERLAADHQELLNHWAGQRQALHKIRLALTSWVQELAARWDAARAELQRRQWQLELRAAELQRRAKELIDLETRLSASQAEWEALRAQTQSQFELLSEHLHRTERSLGMRIHQFDDQLRELARLRSELAQRQEHYQRQIEELAQERGRVDALREQVAEAQRELEEKRQLLTVQQSRTAAQRQAIARQLRAQRRAQRLRWEAEKARWSQAQPFFSSATPKGTESAGIDPIAFEKLIERLETQWVKWVGQAKLAVGNSPNFDRLAEALQEAIEQRVASLLEEFASRQQNDKLDDLERRYRLAVEEIRQLRAENESLSHAVAEAKNETFQAAKKAEMGAARPALDWEVQKNQWLAALEREESAGESNSDEHRLRLEQIVRRTEELLAEKDREIRHLQKLLEDQSNSLGHLAVGAAAIGEVLDQDPVIQEERQHLQRLRLEWEEKLRRAEVEMSVERAKLARQQMELEEKRRQLEQWEKELEQLAKQQSSHQGAEDSSARNKPARRRWFMQLGLKGEEEDSGT